MDFGAVLDEANAFMQDLPNQTTEPMSDGPDGGLIAQPRQQTPEHNLKVTAFPLDRSMRRLVQHAPQIFIAFRRLVVLPIGHDQFDTATAQSLAKGIGILTAIGNHPLRFLPRAALRPRYTSALRRRAQAPAV